MPTLTPLLDLLNHRSGAARYTPLLTRLSPDALAFAITEEDYDNDDGGGGGGGGGGGSCPGPVLRCCELS